MMPNPPHSQIWKRKKKTGTWKLEACCLGSCSAGVGAAAALLTSLLRASDVIHRRPSFAQLLRTFPWRRLQHFTSSTINWLISHLVHHHLITHWAQLSDLISVFEVVDSSTRGISQNFKGGRVWRRDWVLGVFFGGDWLTERSS
jgi:hypothetical protein